MKIGLDSYSYHLAFGAHPDFSPKKKMTIFEFIDKVIDLKLDGIQVDPMHIKSKDSQYLQEISTHCSENNLFLEYGAMGIDSHYLNKELDYCASLNSKILRTFIGFDRFSRSTDIQAEIKNAINQLNKIKSKAQDLDIKIAIENHGDVATDELVQIVESVNSSHIGICLDIGNPMVTMEDPVVATQKMAPYAFSTHFKDYKTQMTNYGFKVFGVALGDGDIDLIQIFKIIQMTSQLDRIILEIPVESESIESESLNKEDHIIKRSVEFVQNILLKNHLIK